MSAFSFWVFNVTYAAKITLEGNIIQACMGNNTPDLALPMPKARASKHLQTILTIYTLAMTLSRDSPLYVAIAGLTSIFWNSGYAESALFICLCRLVITNWRAIRLPQKALWTSDAFAYITIFAQHVPNKNTQCLVMYKSLDMYIVLSYFYFIVIHIMGSQWSMYII